MSLTGPAHKEISTNVGVVVIAALRSDRGKGTGFELSADRPGAGALMLILFSRARVVTGNREKAGHPRQGNTPVALTW